MGNHSKLARERDVIRHLNQLTKDFAFENENGHTAHVYFKPVPALSIGLPVPIFGAMLLIWQLRNQDLQLIYPLDTVANRLEFLSWCVTSGVKEYALLRECAPFWDALSKPAFNTRNYATLDAAHAISWLMVLTALRHPDINADLSTEIGRAKMLLWYLQHGFVAADIAPHIEEWQRTFLSTSLSSGINVHQHILYQARDDLRKAFPLPDALQYFNEWYVTSAEYLSLRSAEIKITKSHKIEQRNLAAFGVNVIGHISAVSGIAEDSRMVLASLRHTTIQKKNVDYSASASTPDNRTHSYAINLFCFPALEQARYVAENGLSNIINRYNIGYWPWEISHWPEQWHHLFSLVDEVWASSKHIQDAIAPVASIPVFLMPMAVEAPSVSRINRVDFSLPEDVFLFYFAFDLRSSSARKNPEACIAAFQTAFPDSKEVGLVIKALKPSESSEAWENLKSLSLLDRRIHVIEQTLSRSDLMALYSMCDCFVSLHRAEGFGRNIAEAMILGKPVIVTDYSGNQTFTTAENSVLVPYVLKEIKEGDYPSVIDGVWAEPNIESAAAGMRRIAKDPQLAETLHVAALNTMLHHSTFRVAQTYLARIKQIDTFHKN